MQRGDFETWTRCRKRKQVSKRERNKVGQLIKARSFNNANVITCSGPHTCLAPNHINTGVVEKDTGRKGKPERWRNMAEDGDDTQNKNQQKIK